MRAELMLCAGMLLALAGCSMPGASTGDAIRLSGGDPVRGAEAITHYGCGSCHTISPIQSARGLVGPPLDGIRNRVYVAGMLHNDAGNLTEWVHDPKAVNPKTAMPNLGVTMQEARDITAYLYSIR